MNTKYASKAEQRRVEGFQKPLDLAQFEGHTPGPWSANVSDPQWDGEIRMGNGLPIATPRQGAHNADANTLLLAAAPALLAECRRQREELDVLLKLYDQRTLQVAKQRDQIKVLREALEQIAQADHPDYPHFRSGTEAAFGDHLMEVARAALKATE